MLKPQQLFLVREPVDMRRGIDALTQHLEGLNLRWQDEAAFVFCNKARSRLKVLRWDRHGVWLCTRRLRRAHLLAPGKGQTQRAYLWTYVTGSDTSPAVVYYELHPGRSGRYAQSLLKDWSGGTLVTDDYAGYNALHARADITEAGCWAPARRKFFDQYKASQSSVAKQALDGIRDLYKLERKIKHRPPDKRRQWRQRYARPWLNEFRSWLQKIQTQTVPNSGLRKAIDYTLKRWSALVCYLDDGWVPIDNNRAENAVRGVAVGRKNGLFAGSLPAGQRAAMIMSLLETARANGHEPWVWLRDVLSRLPSWPNNRLNELLPWPENPFR